ncbi:MAG: NAD(P)H-hydrate dehydratase [Deltaproteobacteria bacterium]|jgi:NAD(P)H-hydrate epimerase|nr:NAD(P)H-hydrate dehydratase [Deltaproteobacteria bacterium]
MILVTAGEMQEMDRQAIETHGIPGLELMENAGRGATDVLLDQFAGSIKTGVSIICGKGNNGGDGFVIARYLAERRIDVTVYLLSKATEVKGDAAANLKRLASLKVPVIEIPDENSFLKIKSDLCRFDLLVDAILGTGLTSDVRGFFKTVINFINDLNRSGIPVFAVDMPSGLNSDTGQPCGTCIRAQGTATFALAKIGHYTYPGADYTGKLEIIDIGIPASVVESVGPKQYLLTAERIRAALPLRSAETHKGRTGHLLVVAGSTGKTGAAAMTAVSAMRAGAGLVTLGIAESLNPIIEAQVMEVMTAPLPECRYGILAATAIDVLTMLADGKSCLAIGPGIGQAEETRSLVRKIISQIDTPLVIDADGLNNIAGQTQLLKKAKGPVVLTPHPGEMARLIEASSTVVQQNRLACARDFATNFGVHVVLKGAATVIAHPDGSAYINPTGNPGMASGGMGDVLTGVLAGFITQGLTPKAATHAAVYLHGAAADTLAQTVGPIGYLAGEVMNTIPREIKKLLKNKIPQPAPK